MNIEPDDPRLGGLSIDPNRLHNLVQEQLFADPTGGMIQARFMLQMVRFMQASNLSEHERSGALNLMLLLALKLSSIWAHLQRYIEHEERLTALAKASPADKRLNQPVRTLSGQDLYLELDGFLVQLKSLLDQMVNVLHYTLGIKLSALHTFGDKGDDIIKVLRNNVPSRPANLRQIAQMLVRHIENNKDWLKGFITIRDRMNHFTDGGLPPRHFRVLYLINEDSTEQLVIPRLNTDLTVRDWMKGLFHNVMDFAEYFVGAAFGSRITGVGLQFRQDQDGNNPRWAWFDETSIKAAIAGGQVQSEMMPGTPRREAGEKR